MIFLRGIAADCCRVKNYVYEHYSGVKNLNNLTPVYTILNEMRYCGLREQLNLPAVYYELAIADAVTNIKCSWGIVKNKVGEKITANENLSDDDRIYLRTVLKIGSVYTAILNRQEYEMHRNSSGLEIDVKRLNNLLCRLTRRYLTQPTTNHVDSFRISPNGYSYKDGAIRIVCRTPRKRITIPLKDERVFDRQIQVHIKEDAVALAVPIDAKIKKHQDYTNTIYIHIGNQDMFTLSNEHVYGASLADLTNPETERLAKKNQERYKIYTVYRQNAESGNRHKTENIETNNLGRRKYDSQPPGSYQVTMNTTWHFPSGDTASEDAYVKNAEANTNAVYFDITRQDTEETIYESPIIPVGSWLEDITLDSNLPDGTYPCVIIYHLLDEEDKSISTVKLTLTIIIGQPKITPINEQLPK